MADGSFAASMDPQAMHARMVALAREHGPEIRVTRDSTGATTVSILGDTIELLLGEPGTLLVRRTSQHLANLIDARNGWGRVPVELSCRREGNDWIFVGTRRETIAEAERLVKIVFSRCPSPCHEREYCGLPPSCWLRRDMQTRERHTGRLYLLSQSAFSRKFPRTHCRACLAAVVVQRRWRAFLATRLAAAITIQTGVRRALYDPDMAVAKRRMKRAAAEHGMQP